MTTPAQVIGTCRSCGLFVRVVAGVIGQHDERGQASAGTCDGTALAPVEAGDSTTPCTACHVPAPLVAPSVDSRSGWWTVGLHLAGSKVCSGTGRRVLVQVAA